MNNTFFEPIRRDASIASNLHYVPIIGLEVHVELKTKSKMFCGCSADYFGHKPNTHCCPVCLGLPGALPVPNKKAVEWCIMIGLALNCKVNEESYFERKNYFYPDLAKGYQISQYNKPLTYGGWLEIKSEIRNSKYETNPKSQIPNPKRIRINRVHMEEDTGKLTHAELNGEKCSLVDFNRSGVPLVEIVTEPDFNNTDEVTAYLKKLHQIIRYLGVSDADMEKGTMRLEPNISIKIKNQKSKIKSTMQKSKIDNDLPNYRVEIKNINSFRFVKKAIDYEIKRQIELLKKGGKLTFETRGWDEDKSVTFPQRAKEEANDYRYFPEPDIPPMRFAQNQILNIKNQIGELPDAKMARFIKEYGLSEYDTNILCDSREMAEYYEKAVNSKQLTDNSKQITPKIVANWIINKKADITKVSPEELVKTIASKSQGVTLNAVDLEAVIKKVVKENGKAVQDYKSGKENALMFLVGMVMREVKGSGNAGKIKERILVLIT